MGMDLLRLDLLHHMVQPDDQDQNPLLNLLMNQQSRLHNMIWTSNCCLYR